MIGVVKDVNVLEFFTFSSEGQVVWHERLPILGGSQGTKAKYMYYVFIINLVYNFFLLKLF
jgi:hypothetical protein